MMNRIFGILICMALMAVVISSCTSGDASNENGEGSVSANEAMNVNQAPDAKAMAVVNSDDPVTGYKVGDKATDFLLMGIDDQEHSLSELTDAKGYVVTFTCNHCPYAVMYEDRIIDFHNTYAAKGYPVIAINPNDPGVEPEDSFDNMKVRAKDKKFPFLYLFDEHQKIYPQYGATKTPHVFLLDKDMVVRYIGAIDNSPRDASAVTTKYLEDAIKALEEGKDPEPSYTKAVGCSIKAKKS